MKPFLVPLPPAPVRASVSPLWRTIFTALALYLGALGLSWLAVFHHLTP